MIDIQRYLLIAAIAALSFMLLIEWKNFEGPETVIASSTAANKAASPVTSSGDSDLPILNQNTESSSLAPTTNNSSGVITVSTDVLNIKIDLHGGDIVYAGLPAYTANLESDDPFVILESNESRDYIAQSGLIGQNATDTSKGRPQFIANADSYELADGGESINVDLHYQYSDQINIVKRFHFKRGEYLIKICLLYTSDAADE